MSIGINVVYVYDINTLKRKAMSVSQHLSRQYDISWYNKMSSLSILQMMDDRDGNQVV